MRQTRLTMTYKRDTPGLIEEPLWTRDEGSYDFARRPGRQPVWGARKVMTGPNLAARYPILGWLRQTVHEKVRAQTPRNSEAAATG